MATTQIETKGTITFTLDGKTVTADFAQFRETAAHCGPLVSLALAIDITPISVEDIPDGKDRLQVSQTLQIPASRGL
jgi:hypothetical protein